MLSIFQRRPKTTSMHVLWKRKHRDFTSLNHAKSCAIWRKTKQEKIDIYKQMHIETNHIEMKSILQDVIRTLHMVDVSTSEMKSTQGNIKISIWLFWPYFFLDFRDRERGRMKETERAQTSAEIHQGQENLRVLVNAISCLGWHSVSSTHTIPSLQSNPPSSATDYLQRHITASTLLNWKGGLLLNGSFALHQRAEQWNSVALDINPRWLSSRAQCLACVAETIATKA